MSRRCDNFAYQAPNHLATQLDTFNLRPESLIFGLSSEYSIEKTILRDFCIENVDLVTENRLLKNGI